MKYLEYWLPPDGAGNPVGCLATSFTFDADFFSEECLGRFLALPSRDSDATAPVEIVARIEEEERLAETPVCVLVDRSYRPQPRSLRWDLLPVSVPGGLLHAKVAVLMWEELTRVVLGSANLTAAGYRDQVEVGVALDLEAGCLVPREVFKQLVAELRSILALAPGGVDRPGPQQRASLLLTGFLDRVARAPLPDSPPRGIRVALGPTGPKAKPLEMLDAVWNGSPPQSVVALSPYWDDTEAMAGARAVLARLAARAPTGGRTSARFVVPVDDAAGHHIIRAPERLISIADARLATEVEGFSSPDGRRLHAKCLQYRSANWLATMIGSSNMTSKGLGEDPRPHRELNLWIGCRPDSDVGKVLGNLIPPGVPFDLDLADWDVLDDDEDEVQFQPLPAGFVEALLEGPTSLRLSLDERALPKVWEIHVGGLGVVPVVLMSSEAWERAGRPPSVEVSFPERSEVACSVLEVAWEDGSGRSSAPWMVNVVSGKVLPQPAEFAGLPLQSILAILASSRPLYLRDLDNSGNGTVGSSSDRDELDPLKRFDSSGLLLQRIRQASAALAGLERRLDQPVRTMDALEWRLAGVLGPEYLAHRLLEATGTDRVLPGEHAFLLAELALTVHGIDWTVHAPRALQPEVNRRVRETISLLLDGLLPLQDDLDDVYLRAYIDAVRVRVGV